mmetsp:Transcript_50480/g.157627  ORF Transcript_50480/g.157627 Transcript_50480/m.157627 type:complete len:218 (+) Transcript_50480:2738-3391(+)
MEPRGLLSVPRSSLPDLFLGSIHQQVVCHGLPVPVNPGLQGSCLGRTEKVLELPIERGCRLLQSRSLGHRTMVPVIGECGRELVLGVRSISGFRSGVDMLSQTLHLHLQVRDLGVLLLDLRLKILNHHPCNVLGHGLLLRCGAMPPCHVGATGAGYEMLVLEQVSLSRSRHGLLLVAQLLLITEQSLCALLQLRRSLQHLVSSLSVPLMLVRRLGRR